MAVPHVAGAAALYLELKPKALPSEVKSQILATAGKTQWGPNITTALLPGTPNLTLNTMALTGTAYVTASEGPSLP